MTFKKNAVKPSPLTLLDPVPSDIDIAKAAYMKPIKELAEGTTSTQTFYIKNVIF